MSISVALATYNAEKYLAEQIQSILAQTLQPAELMVCDDCSTDRTVSILKEYAAQGKLKYVVNNEQLGVIRNFKKAVSLVAKDNYVALSDQDDIWLPQKLELTFAALQSVDDPGKPCISYSDLTLVDINNNVISPSFQSIFGHDKYVHNLETQLYSNTVNGCTVIMNTPACEQFLQMPDDVRSHDEWLTLVAFTFGNVAQVKDALVRYRSHDDNTCLPVDFQQLGWFERAAINIKNIVIGDDDFLRSQFDFVKKFYDCYAKLIPIDKAQKFRDFLQLRSKSFYKKKTSFRRVINKYRL